VDEVVSNHIHRSHFSGAPYFDRNENVLDQSVELAERIATGQRKFDPYVAGHRVQHGPSGPKTRLVWMAPLATTILSTRFSKPVYKGMERRFPFAFGLDAMEKGSFISELRASKRYIYCLDYSKFDSSISAQLIKDAFNICKTHLEMTSDEERLFDEIIADFIHTRIVDHDANIWRVHRGVPSGSSFTSIIDSIVNIIVLQYVFMKLGGKSLSARDFSILGDDAIVGYDRKFHPAEMARTAAQLGITISTEKSVTVDTRRSDAVSFLGHEWRLSKKDRNPNEIVKRMVFPERHAKRSISLSLLRFLGYSADAVSWWEVFDKVFPQTNTYHALVALIDDIHEDEIVGVKSLGLGYLEYLVVVEDRQDLSFIGTRRLMTPLIGGLS